MAQAGRNAGAKRDAPALRLDLDRYVPSIVTAIVNKLSRSATVLYQKEFGVNVTEWRIMALLAVEPGISARRICQVIGFDKGPVSRTLRVMEGRGLVTIRVDEADARQHTITLTPAGFEKHDAIIRVALERERRLLACLDPTEQEQLIGLLVRVHGNLGAIAADRPLD